MSRLRIRTGGWRKLRIARSSRVRRLRRLLTPALLFGASLIAALIGIVGSVVANHLPAGFAKSTVIPWLSLAILLCLASGSSLLRRYVDDRSLPKKDPETFTSVVPAIKQIPPDVPNFVGREKELIKLRGLVFSPSSCDSVHSLRCSINGRVGVGKTVLAVHFAHLVESNYPDVHLRLDLRGSTSSPLASADALAKLLLGLGVPSDLIPDDFDRRTDLYRSITKPYRLLLLLDDAVSSAQIRPLVPSSDICAIIVTSRAALIGLEGFTSLELQELSPKDADFFIVSTIGADRVTTEADRLKVAEIAKSCGYLPLALRIVTGQLGALGSLTVSIMAKRLADERKLLSNLAAEDISIETAFTSAYNFLPVNLRRMVARLGTLPNYPFSPPTASALWGVETEHAEAALQQLATLRLIDGSVSPGSTDQYYEIHSLLRLFLKQRASAEFGYLSQRSAVRRMVCSLLRKSYYADLRLSPVRLHLADVVTARQRRRLSAQPDLEIVTEPVAWFDSEGPALASLVATAQRYRLQTLAQHLALTLGGYYEFRADWAHWRGVIDMALPNARRALGPGGEALLLANLGDLEAEQGNYDEAIAAFKRASLLFQDAGSTVGWAYALSSIGNVEIERSNLSAAVAAFTECLNLPPNDVRIAAHGEHGLGVVRQRQGQFDEAIQLFSGSVQAAKNIDDYHWAAINERSIGMTLHLQQKYVDAIPHLQVARDWFNQLGDLRWAARTDASLANAYRRIDLLPEAASVLKDSLRIFQQLHDVRWQIETMRTLGLVNCRLGEYSEGIRTISDALRLASENDDEHQVAIVRCNLGEAYLLSQQPMLGHEELTAAASAFQKLGDEYWLAQCSTLLNKG